MFSPKAAFSEMFCLTGYLVPIEEAEASWPTFVEAAKQLETGAVAALAAVAFMKRTHPTAIECTALLESLGEPMAKLFDREVPERNRKHAACLLLAAMDTQFYSAPGSLAAVLTMICAQRVDDVRVERILIGVAQYATQLANDRRKKFRNWIKGAFQIAVNPTGQGPLDAPAPDKKVEAWLDEIAGIQTTLISFSAASARNSQTFVAHAQHLANATRVLPFIPDYRKMLSFADEVLSGEVKIIAELTNAPSETLVALFSEVAPIGASLAYSNAQELSVILERAYLETLASRITDGGLL